MSCEYETEACRKNVHCTTCPHYEIGNLTTSVKENEPIKSIKTINPKPTDIIVLRFGDIKVDEMQHCFDHVEKKFPNNTVVALPSPVELEVASKELWEDYIRMIYETVKAMP